MSDRRTADANADGNGQRGAIFVCWCCGPEGRSSSHPASHVTGVSFGFFFFGFVLGTFLSGFVVANTALGRMLSKRLSLSA